MRKTMYLFNEAPFRDRLSVYDNYVYLCNKKGLYGEAHLDFEEFCEAHRRESFYSVMHQYGVYDE